MCFVTKKALLRRIDSLEGKINELSEVIKTQELERLRKISEEHEETLRLLSHVGLKVKSIKEFEDQDPNGRRTIQVIYERPIVTLALDQDGNPEKDEAFYAINALGLIGIDDMEKLQRTLDKYKK